MKLIALSDIHYDERTVEAWKTIDAVVAKDPDIILIGGDLAGTKVSIQEALARFECRAAKLAYLGNHELSTLEHSVLGEHYEEMATLFSDNGFSLLDAKPYVSNSYAFVGNSGWFDFSHYRGDRAAIESAICHHYERYRVLVSPQEFTEVCIARLEQQLADYKDKKVILGIHHIGFSEMLHYGLSRELDYKNLFMGSVKLRRLYASPQVVLGFCGHNHRSSFRDYCNKKVYNISSDDAQPFLEVDLP